MTTPTRETVAAVVSSSTKTTAIPVTIMTIPPAVIHSPPVLCAELHVSSDRVVVRVLIPAQLFPDSRSVRPSWPVATGAMPPNHNQHPDDPRGQGLEISVLPRPRGLYVVFLILLRILEPNLSRGGSRVPGDFGT
jgi:hypothetical protein